MKKVEIGSAQQGKGPRLPRANWHRGEDINEKLMTVLMYEDFFDPIIDTDRSPRVVNIYRCQFPDLYQAEESAELKTSDGRPLILKGDTLITYRSAIKRIYGKYFGELDSATQNGILSVLETYSCTLRKQIRFSDGVNVINNHQIGNMMPFPSSTPSMNTLRAAAYYDYFDRFLEDVRSYYVNPTGFVPASKLQAAIQYQHGYFDFFKSYDQYIAQNLLQDFVGKDLWGITDFREYVRVENESIEARSKRYTVPEEQR